MNTDPMLPFNGVFDFNYYRVDDGQSLRNEKIYGGNAILQNQKIVSFARLEEGPFGYSGTFSADGKNLRIKIQTCIAPDLEGKTFNWTYEWLTSTDCRISGVELSTGRQFEMLVRRV